MAAKTIKGITVEIGGNTTKLGDALKDATKKGSELQNSLKQVNKALKMDPTSVELLTEKQKILSDAVKAARERLDTLKEAQAQVAEQYRSGDIDQGAYLAFQNELEQAKQKLADLEQQQRSFAGAIGQTMQEAGRHISDFGKKIEGAGETLTKSVTTPLLAVGTGAAVMASGFEDAMAKVSTIADTSQVPLSDLREGILELSDQTGISAEEIADNVYNAISAGQETGDAVAFVANAASLAKAGFTDSAAALDILTTTLNAYGMEADEVGRVSDVLIQTQNLGKTTVGELAGAMGKVIPTAKANGVELETLAGAYAVMTSNGIATAETTTYLNSMLNELGKQGTTAADAFAKGTEHIKEGGLTMAEAMERGWDLSDVLSILDEEAAASGTTIQNMFGSAEAGKAANVLWDNASKLNDAIDAMGNSAGSTQEAFDKLDTTSNKARISLNLVKNAGIDFGTTILEMMAPVLDKVAGYIKSVTDKLKGMDDGQKRAIVTIGAVVAAVGPAFTIFGKITTGVGGFITKLGQLPATIQTVKAGFTAFSGLLSGGVSAAISGVGSALSFLAANPVVLIVAGIAALVAAFVTAYNKVEWFRNGVNAVVDAVKGKWEALKEGFTAGASAIGSAFSTGMETVRNTASTVMEAARATVQEKLSNMRAAYEENGGGIRGAAAAAMEGVKGYFTAGLTFVDQLTGGKLSELLSRFNILDEARTKVSSIMDNIKGAFSEKIEAARSAIEQGINNIKNLFNFEWHLPQLKLPHFSISGSFSLDPPSVPHLSVSWYAKGAVLKGAQIFGQMGSNLLGGGEAGAEAVLPLSGFYRELRAIFAEYMGDGRGNAGGVVFNMNQTINSPEPLTPAETARQNRQEVQKAIQAIRRL